MSVKYELKDLDVSKLPTIIRERLDETPHHTIFYLEDHDKPEFCKGDGKDTQFLFLGLTEGGFCCLKCDPSEITYPLNDYFESIKCGDV